MALHRASGLAQQRKAPAWVSHHDASLSSEDLFIDTGIPPQATNPINPLASFPEKSAFELICWLSEDIVLGLLQVSDN